MKQLSMAFVCRPSQPCVEGDFLGLGIQPPTPSWGNMLNAAQSLQVLVNEPWVWIGPGLAIALTVLSINFLGDGLRDALDPHL